MSYRTAFIGFVAGCLVGALGAVWLRPLSGNDSRMSGFSEDATAGPTPSATRMVASGDAVAIAAKTEVRPAAIPLWEILRTAGKRSGPEGDWLKLPAITKLYGFSRDNPVTDEFAAFFQLSEAERVQLNTIILDVLAKQEALDLQLVERLPKGDRQGDFALKIPSYPEKGAQLYDGLKQGLRAVMGEERYGVLESWNGDDLDRNFTGLGLYEREFWITRPSATDSSWVAIYFERGPDGHYRQFGSNSPTLREMEQTIRFPISKLEASVKGQP